MAVIVAEPQYATPVRAIGVANTPAHFEFFEALHGGVAGAEMSIVR